MPRLPLFFCMFLFAANPYAHSLPATDFEHGMNAFQAGDFQTAIKVWHQLAQDGNADAQYALGSMLEYGRGMPPDDAKAADWYSKAAVQENSEAQYRLGVFYENGWGVNPDAKKAVFWYSGAAEQGHAFAQHDLAFMLLEGKGVKADKVQAYKWLRIASERRGSVMNKHLYSISKALNMDEIQLAEKLALDWLMAQERFRNQ